MNKNREDKIYPTNARFLLVDDVRVEAGSGKAILIGVFVGDDVIIKKSKGTEVNALASVTFFGLLSGGKGEFTAEAKITSPSKNVRTKPLKPISLEHGKNAVLVLKVEPFPIESRGQYELEIVLDGEKSYRYSFRVDVIESDHTSA